MELETGWHAWKRLLGRIVKVTDSVGISEDRINESAYLVGEFLAHYFDPGNREQRLLKELWDEADDEQRRVLAKLMVRLVEESGTKH